MDKRHREKFTHDVWTLKNFRLCSSIAYVVGSLKPKGDVIKKMTWPNPITLLKSRRGGKKCQKKDQDYSRHSIATFATLATKIATLRFRVATHNNKKSQRSQRKSQRRDFFCVAIALKFKFQFQKMYGAYLKLLHFLLL